MLRRVALMFGLFGFGALLVQLPWGALRKRFAIISSVRVEGAHYLEPASIVHASGLEPGNDLFALDIATAQRHLLAHPRIARADVRREGIRRFVLRVEEREPVMLVDHGVPWEVDSSGVLLPPLAEGMVADVPRLTGTKLSRVKAGETLRAVEVQRGLAWVRALSARELQLAGMVSELDVSDPHTTGLLLMDGTRVLSPAWPPGVTRLSALRVVLADLKHRGTLAQEVDLRFEHQVIVRPAPSTEEDASRSS
jgi:cell division protein FtsQ